MEITITIHLHPSAPTPSIPQAQGGVVGFPTSVHPQHHNTAPSLILWRRLSLLLLGLPTTTARVMYNKGYINLTLVFHCSQRRDMWMWCEWRGWPFCLPPPPLSSFFILCPSNSIQWLYLNSLRVHRTMLWILRIKCDDDDEDHDGCCSVLFKCWW